MWAFVIRRLVYNVPVYLAIVFMVMLLLRVKDPIPGMLGKNANQAEYMAKKVQLGLAYEETLPSRQGVNEPAGASIGDTTIDVVDAAVFSVGDFVEFSDTAEAADFSGRFYKIKAISGNTLTIVQHPAGDGGLLAAVPDKANIKKSWDKPFLSQYVNRLREIATLNFKQELWTEPGKSVGEKLRKAVVPSLMLTIPALVLTSLISIIVGMISAFSRGRLLDKTLVFCAVLGMSVSFLVYIILGQYFGAYQLSNLANRPLFSIHGYEPGLQNWAYYMLLPVMISVIVSMGYDTRFYRAVMVEEVGQDYITTAKSKGASQNKIMFVHMLRNAMIPIITRIMITLPFLVTGSILLESFFGIPGMGYVLLSAIKNNDFPVIEVFTSIFAGMFIISIIATDVLYALFDPRVRLQ